MSNERELSEQVAATQRRVQEARLADMAKRAASLAEDRVRHGDVRRDAKGRIIS
jgi:hypothetical protein